jgi:hypothetical protein
MRMHLYAHMCWRAWHGWSFYPTWHALKSKTALWENRMSMNPDIAFPGDRDQAKKDNRRLMQIARNWARKGWAADNFAACVRAKWPTGYARLGAHKVAAAIHIAKGGF